MIDIERPACFYLGKEYDLAAKKVLDQPVMYDAHNLTTHGVVVGMTGSGKTGLCLSLLEEAAIDGIPCIMIDLKGDITNLLLNFPELRPEDFEPWIDPDAARRKKKPLKEYAEQTAATWKKGLADWGQEPDRVSRLRQSSEWRVFTPGSDAALPVSILQTFAAPKGNISREALYERVDAATTGLLGLTGISADPVQSREHILIAQLLLHAWLKGQDMDLPKIITQIQVPPIRKVGAFEVDTFYPEKERHQLALALNNILASPSFATWIEGQPLDLGPLMYAADGRPRQLIFYLAHLDDAQRMFFTALLLEEVLAWTRSQPGTTSLRAILYFDEVFGYLPPHPANPPTKRPLMTLMKQGRAFGLGVLLATQNPVDLDYKALTNAGTWFVGKLQTERDKARLLEGLEGVAAAQGTLTDRGHLNTVISSIGNRVFLLHNVHAGRPLLLHSRWALSYLAGPLTRDQVARLAEPIKAEVEKHRRAPAKPQAAEKCPECGSAVPSAAKFCMECGHRLPVRVEAAREDQFKQAIADLGSAASALGPTSHVPPVLPPGTSQFFLPAVPLAARPGDPATPRLVYEPRLLGFGEVRFADERKGVAQVAQVAHHKTYHLLAVAPRADEEVVWAEAESIADTARTTPEAADADWLDVPNSINDPKKLRGEEKAFAAYLQQHAALTAYQNRQLDLRSEPEEDRDHFIERCREAARRAGEAELGERTERYRQKFAAADGKLLESQAELQKAKKENEEILKQGGGILDLVWSGFGFSSAKPSPRAVEAAGKRTQKAQGVVERHQTAKQKLHAEWQAAAAGIAERWQAKAEDVKELRLTPRKADVLVTRFGLAWAPFWRLESGGSTHLLPAYVRQSVRA